MISVTFADKPNIILIMADDLAYGDVSCYGAKKQKTHYHTVPIDTTVIGFELTT